MKNEGEHPARLRVGIVGASFGGTVHAPAFAAQGGFEVVAIASPNRAEAVAQTRRIPHAFASLDAMLAGVELDVVSIASPPYEHRVQVEAALARGKHVLCEKPFGLNVAECGAMVAAAAGAGTVCAIAHEFRYLPSRLATLELIRNGHLGALRDIEVAWYSGMLRAEGERPNSWWFERAKGGGITGAILSHLIDTANWLAAAPIVQSTGFSRTANPERHSRGVHFTTDAADGGFALIEYAGGIVARCTVDATHAFDTATLAAHGEQRTVVSNGPSVMESTTFVIEPDEDHELELKASPHASIAPAHPNLPAFVDLLDDFAAAIAGRPAPNLPTFADGLATQRVLEAIGYRA